MDRADVVRAWECCIDTENGPCAEDCPMKDAEWKDRGLAACRVFADDHVEVPLALVQRTVELLKAQEAQEAVKPIMDIDTWVCGQCGTRVERQSMAGPNVLIAEQLDFCPNCGRAVKWDA